MQGRAQTAVPASSVRLSAVPPIRGEAGAKRERQRLIRDLVAGESIGSQQELVDRLNAHGFGVTQATVSRDIAELGLVKRAGDGAYQRAGADATNPETALTAP
jgi:transcriptional regulator of arginine metabolism